MAKKLLWRFRQAELSDERTVTSMYKEAISLLRERGIDQWQERGPDRESFLRDQREGESFLLEVREDDCPTWQAAGTMYLSSKEEPSYYEIEGSWASPLPYLVIHRVALAEKFRGLGLGACFYAYAGQVAAGGGFGQIRIDTHQDNLAMQKLLAANGFTKRGIIWLDPEDHRPAQMRYAYDVSLATLAEAQEKWPLKNNQDKGTDNHDH